MMKKTRKSISALAVMGAFLIGGCGEKERVPIIPGEAVVNEMPSSAAEQTTAVDETQAAVPDAVQPETSVQSEGPAKTESASEPEPGNGQETGTAQIAPAQEVGYMDIVHIFEPYGQAVEMSFQMPEDWEYTVEDIIEEYPDWGYSVKAFGRDDTNFFIKGQYGTLAFPGHQNGPESFQTSQGLTGQYFWDEHVIDDKDLVIDGMLIFDTELAGFYGVVFDMPKSVYSENKDMIDKMFQSIVIKEAQ